ncbi:MAG: patatin-like phospholipase family protein [Hyphomicrobium sp.]
MRRDKAPQGAKGPSSKRGTPSASKVASQQWESACTPEQLAKRGARKAVNLALQGGGAHGAFGWGVLDKLLEDDRLAPDAISATSAGAMNAVVMAIGISEGGKDGARARLEEFWREVSRAGQLWNPIRQAPWDGFGGNGNGNGGGMPSGLSIGYLMFEAMTRIWSPYQFNPFDLNPLKDVLGKVVDFERLRGCRHATRLFLCATNVRTSKIRVFENHEITPEAVMASACLPYVFKAVEVEGEHYWDGGFMGNPAIFPLIYRGASRDVIVVHINPIVRDTVPTTAPEIFDRMNEISFNSSLMREMRAIAFVSRLLEEEAVDDTRYKRMLIHAVRNDEEMARYGAESKFDSSWSFLCHLRDAGRAATTAWLEASFEGVGQRTTIDLAGTYL